MKGIYYIKCLTNNRVYIGSSVGIKERIKRHIWALKNKKHVNSYLQNSWNKYGEINFRVGVIEICESEEILAVREQFYINNNKKLFNIVRQDVTRISLDVETRRKIASKISAMYLNGEIPRINGGSIKKGQKPWNTGRKYESTEHLKVPKLKKGDRSGFVENYREKLPEIQVFDKNGNHLGNWRSAKDLQEESNKKDFRLIPYMELRNPDGRQGYNPYLLQSVNINKSNKMNKPYKGLYFKHGPLLSDE